MQKTDEILLTIAVIVLLLTVILTVLLWQIRRSREKMRNREALTEQLTRENAEMIERQGLGPGPGSRLAGRRGVEAAGAGPLVSLLHFLPNLPQFLTPSVPLPPSHSHQW